MQETPEPETEILNPETTDQTTRPLCCNKPLHTVALALKPRKVIKAARYKMVGGAEVHTLMADTLNLNEAHTSEQWKRIWARKTAGTTPGCSGISSTMMKIMQKRMRNDKGEVSDSPLLWLSYKKMDKFSY